MKYYFLRHADALEGADDFARPLSPRGTGEAREIGRFLKRAAVNFDSVYSSPLVRARETAERVAQITNDSKPVRLETAGALLNEASAPEFAQWLSSLPAADHILLAGHAPSLAERVCALLAVHAKLLKLPKAGLACLETEDRQRFSLKFLVSPKVLGL
jgi:phosphohistidine phosphatase